MAGSSQPVPGMGPQVPHGNPSGQYNWSGQHAPRPMPLAQTPYAPTTAPYAPPGQQGFGNFAPPYGAPSDPVPYAAQPFNQPQPFATPQPFAQQPASQFGEQQGSNFASPGPSVAPMQTPLQTPMREGYGAPRWGYPNGERQDGEQQDYSTPHFTPPPLPSRPAFSPYAPAPAQPAVDLRAPMYAQMLANGIRNYSNG